MRYIASLEKYPITWEVVADSDEEAEEKGWEVIGHDMTADSIINGGMLVLKKCAKCG